MLLRRSCSHGYAVAASSQPAASAHIAHVSSLGLWTRHFLDLRVIAGLLRVTSGSCRLPVPGGKYRILRNALGAELIISTGQPHGYAVAALLRGNRTLAIGAKILRALVEFGPRHAPFA